MYKELQDLRIKTDELEKNVEQYKTLESTLQSTLVMAQTTAEEVKSVAKQKADQIVEEAKRGAKKEVDDLENTIFVRRKEMEEMKKQFDMYKAKMEALLISQLELLKDVNKNDD